MENILLLVHTEADGSLAKSALESLQSVQTLAGALGGAMFSVGIVGETIQAAANQIATCGAAKFLGVEGADFAQPRYASDAAAVEALCRAAQATLVVAPATSRWNRVLAGVAQRLNGRVETHVTGLGVENCTVNVSRWYYRQRMEATLARTQRPWNRCP